MECEDGCLHACKDQGKEQPAQNYMYMYMYISIMRQYEFHLEFGKNFFFCAFWCLIYPSLKIVQKAYNVRKTINNKL